MIGTLLRAFIFAATFTVLVADFTLLWVVTP